MLQQAFPDHALGRTQVFEWHARFKSERGSVEDEARSGRPITSKMTEKIGEFKP